jgi:hypothetical protein
MLVFVKPQCLVFRSFNHFGQHARLCMGRRFFGAGVLPGGSESPWRQLSNAVGPWFLRYAKWRRSKRSRPPINPSYASFWLSQGFLVPMQFAQEA